MILLFFTYKLLIEIFGLLWWLRQLRIHLQFRIPGFNPLSQEDSLGKGIATHSSILAWRISWTEEPGGLQSVVSQTVKHDWETNTFTFYYRIYTEIGITSILFFRFLKGTQSIIQHPNQETEYSEHLPNSFVPLLVVDLKSNYIVIFGFFNILLWKI